MTGRQPGGSGNTTEKAHATLGSIEDLIRQLDTLSRRQKTLIENRSINDLIDLFNQRGEIVGKIEAMSSSYRQAVACLESIRSGHCDGDGEVLEEQATRIDRMVAQIARRDRQSRRMLDRCKDSLADEIASMGQKTAAVTAYGGGKNIITTPIFQDKQG